MREIKFRAWDKKLNYMHYGNQYISLSWDKDGLIKNDDLIIEQYTGLTDKNGKEIYEGDILKESYPSKDIYRVVYSGSGFVPVVIKNGERDIESGFDIVESFGCEIISNIHEETK